MAEFLKGWGRDGSQMVLAPAGTPRAVLNRLSGEFARILALPEIREKMAAIGYQAEASTPEETDKIIRAQLDVFARVVREAGLLPK